MKIFYAIQATGNGHIARAIELMPYLQQYGIVDVFLSGNNSNLNFELPVKYTSKGMSLFYGNRGGLDYYKMLKEFSPLRIYKEAKALPIEKYDIVINDFESITSLACRLKNIPSVNFGHQASFMSNKTPRPKHKDLLGEFVLKHYATAKKYIGLHFESYDSFIFSPIIKEQIYTATPKNDGYITVYLSHYSDEVVATQLRKVKNVRFEVFSKQATTKRVDGNITFIPINAKAFNDSMISSYGVITGAGFETPAEALFLGKKLMCLPINGQYEQLCNAAALEKFNVPIIKLMDEGFSLAIEKWLEGPMPRKLELAQTTQQIVANVIKTALSISRKAAIQEGFQFTSPSFNYQ